MQCLSNEYDTLNLFACNYTNHISRGSTPQARDIPLHPTPTHTHLHHRKVPLVGCHVKAAGAVVEREEEQVVAVLLDEQLW
jgi:hypothetical protein